VQTTIKLLSSCSFLVVNGNVLHLHGELKEPWKHWSWEVITNHLLPLRHPHHPPVLEYPRLFPY
jgi:hypothetical protein